jgi:hypothetical protein
MLLDEYDISCVRAYFFISSGMIECSGPGATYLPRSDIVGFGQEQHEHALAAYLGLSNALSCTAVDFGEVIESTEITSVVWKKLLANAVS